MKSYMKELIKKEKKNKHLDFAKSKQYSRSSIVAIENKKRKGTSDEESEPSRKSSYDEEENRRHKKRHAHSSQK